MEVTGDLDWIAEWTGALIEDGCAAPTQRRYLCGRSVRQNCSRPRL